MGVSDSKGEHISLEMTEGEHISLEMTPSDPEQSRLASSVGQDSVRKFS